VRGRGRPKHAETRRNTQIEQESERAIPTDRASERGGGRERGKKKKERDRGREKERERERESERERARARARAREIYTRDIQTYRCMRG